MTLQVKKILLKYKLENLTILALLIYWLFAASCAMIKLSAVPSELSSNTIAVKPLYSTDFKKLVFCVLPNSLLPEEEVLAIQNNLANDNIKIVDSQNAKQIYEEQIIKGQSNKTVIDYYIYVEKCDNIYYYQLINGRNYRVDYAQVINTLSSNVLMTPFTGFKHNIDLSFVQFYKTLSDKNYNLLVDNKQRNEIFQKSFELCTAGSAKTFNGREKKKDIETFYNDQYAVTLNLATCYLLNRDFVKCKETIRSVYNLENKTSSNFDRETAYCNTLLQRANSWETAINDSIKAENRNTTGQKKSINISQKEDGIDNSSSRRKDDAKANARVKYAYSNAVISLFRWKGDKIDIFERALVDDILSSNSQITQKAEGKAQAADYLLSLRINNWDKKQEAVKEQYQPTDLLGKPNGPVQNITTYKTSFEAAVNIKITSNKDALILGSRQLKFSKNESTSAPIDYAYSTIFNALFFDDSNAKNFYEQIIE